MNYGSNDDNLERVRNILNLMDRSIDAARARRETPGDVQPAVNHRPGGFNANPISEEAEEARLPTSMFDRSGPRLKARPKRPNN